MFCSMFKKAVAIILMLAVLCTVGVCASAKQPEYSEYIAQTDIEAFEEKVKVDADLSLVGEHSTVGTPAADAVVIKDTVQFDVAVESSGIYNIKLCYVVLSENAEKAEYSLLIDGELPFAEAETLGLNTEYVRINEQILTDKLGNELTPQLKKSDSWINAYLKDASGYQNEPYAFYLSEGAHSIKFTVTDGVLALKEFSLIGVTPRPTYKEYIKEYAGAKNGEYSAFYEAENPISRTSQAIIEACDNSTAAVSPEAQRLTVMNHLGGEAWSMPMQAASWKISVPEDGLYTVSLRYRQNFTNGIYTTRRIYIDGEIPFDELSRVQFPYTADWKSITVGEGEAPYQIYLTAGEHIITAEASLGDMSEIVTKANAIILKLNGIYRNIISITSSTPDSFRDYELDKKIPNSIKEMGEVREAIEALCDDLIALVGKDISETGLLDRMVKQLDEFCEKPRVIPSKLSQFQSNISSLGTWVYDLYKQPLSLDSIAIASKGTKPQFEHGGFFAELIHTVKQFIYSYTDDYALLDDENDKKTVEVWTSMGRDQYQILNQLTEESFNTENAKYRAQVRLISEAALMPAVVAGKGPDVVPSVATGTPINYAIRGAAYDLSGFKDFHEVLSRFTESAVTPFRMGNSVYALPTTMTFSVLFYRTDILSELDIAVPSNWNEVTRAIVQLSQNQMKFGFLPSLTAYCTMLYQNGGELYADNYCELDGELQLKTFSDYTALYSKYGLTVSFDFANRFRSGEMPMGIVDYTTFNTLEVFAPEIKGLWDIALVPGTPAENGIDNTVACDVNGAMIIGDTDVPEGAWEYLSWWTSADIQTRYGQSVENKLGASARYPTANLEALSRMPWSSDFYRVLNEQLSKSKGIPEVAGGYFTTRHFSNAFRAVLYRNQDPIEGLREYTQIINLEINRKRTELGLDKKGEK